MSDQVYLSLWLRDFGEQTMLPYWKRALEEFPSSSLLPGCRTLAVFPFSWEEAPVLEQEFAEGAATDHVVTLAGEFLHEDYAYEAGIHWDVWVPKSAEALDQWERVPQIVTIACLGPQFDSEGEKDRGHLQVNFGMDSLFLPAAEGEELAREAREGVAGSSFRDNIQQLLEYLHRLDRSLPVDRKLLWSGSGENLAEQIRSAWRLSSEPRP